MEEQKNFDLSSYSSFAQQSTKKSNPEQIPQTNIGQKKRMLIYVFWFETFGTFFLTFSIFASNNNGFVIATVYGILLMLSQSQKCTFNPAITFMFAFRDKISWAAVGICSQFLGAFLAGLLGYLAFKNEVLDIAYLSATVNTSLFGDTFGEVLGSAVFITGIIFQYDELLDFTNQRLEQATIIASLYAFGRILAYKSQSSLNPAIALSLEFFESCKDGHWGRFGMFWIFTGGPLLGAILASLFTRYVLKPNFEKQLKSGLRF